MGPGSVDWYMLGWEDILSWPHTQVGTQEEYQYNWSGKYKRPLRLIRGIDCTDRKAMDGTDSLQVLGRRLQLKVWL